MLNMPVKHGLSAVPKAAKQDGNGRLLFVVERFRRTNEIIHEGKLMEISDGKNGPVWSQNSKVQRKRGLACGPPF
jgi:hypothetical protein